jgi:tetrahydromethanopterin S-methyltransferase subunit G
MSDVANGEHPVRPSSYGDLFERLDRIEDKLDRRLDTLDGKVDKVDLKVDITTSRIDRLEGRLEASLGLVKWLGPAGIAALIFGLLSSQGLI